MMPTGASKVTEEIDACLLVIDRKMNLFNKVNVKKNLCVNVDKAYFLVSGLNVKNKNEYKLWESTKGIFIVLYK